ncbi:piggyBac transposable element-derived protein 3-like [Diabrotica virgifera virgifera]|nr:piggyBac transposable element-derived protein 3-like [Diabrotica virgifera virgifera]
MGGVDRCDQNLSLYRISLRSKKWYFPLVAHCIDVALQNAWQLHRQRGGDLDQLRFRRRVATTLLLQNKKKETHSKGHKSSTEGLDIRFDRMDHLVIPQNKQTRCAHCHEKTTTRCSKCDKGLHVKCFLVYHTKSV